MGNYSFTSNKYSQMYFVTKCGNQSVEEIGEYAATSCNQHMLIKILGQYHLYINTDLKNVQIGTHF